MIFNQWLNWKKIKDKYWCRYLILKHELYTWLYLITLFIETHFLFNKIKKKHA
jgi:hypothetical protein